MSENPAYNKMSSILRKILIGLISFTIILAIYLLGSRIGGEPAIDIDIVDDSNINDVEGEIGKFGDVGVGALKNAKFIHRNENREIDRVFGFEELLHQAQGQWEVEKPYMNVYQDSFNCYITADEGKVNVETAVGRPTPKDATLTSDVVIHISPQASSDIKDSFIYLEDVSFFSDKTLFASEGPVKFVSADAQMLGEGFELIYNDQLGRLEYLRIVDLESLRVKSFSGGLFSPTTKTRGSLAEPGQSTKAGEKGGLTKGSGENYKCVFMENVLVDTPEQLIFADDEISINDIFWAKATGEEPGDTGAGTRETGPAGRNEPNELQEDFNDIVISCDGSVIVSPMSVPDLLKSSGKVDSESAGPGSLVRKKLEDAKGRNTFAARRIDYSASTGEVAAPGESRISFYANNVSADRAEQPAMPIEITAQEQTKFLSVSNQIIFDGDCLCSMPSANPERREKYALSAPKLTVDLSKDRTEQGSVSATSIEHFSASGGVEISVLPLESDQDQNSVGERVRFVAEQVDYNAFDNDIVAAGPTELTFYADDIMDTNQEKTTVPINITAQKQTKFLLGSNQVLFKGDCVCSMVREYPGIEQKYTLTAPQLAVNLSSRAAGDGSQLEHFRAIGGVVRLATVKSAGEELISGIELKCSQFDFEQDEQIFVATGPGIIKFANAGVSEIDEETSKFSLRRRCYAFLRNFDTLKFLSDSNLLIADAKEQKMRIDYVPVINGEYVQQGIAYASHIETQLYQVEDGRTELSTLKASGGVSYEDRDNQFIGSRLLYDHRNLIMKVEGDKSQPCYLNGALVDAIEYDLRTGKVKAQVSGLGIMQMK
jgi:hypothetical protein